MNEKPAIVPIQLGMHQEPEAHEPEAIRACEVKIKDAEIIFYNGVDKHILHAVLAELTRYAR